MGGHGVEFFVKAIREGVEAAAPSGGERDKPVHRVLLRRKFLRWGIHRRHRVGPLLVDVAGVGEFVGDHGIERNEWHNFILAWRVDMISAFKN